MVESTFLAMTGAETEAADTLPPHMAWMSCHFSPTDDGLTDLPSHLPPGSILILDDSTPPAGHDSDKIAHQLCAALEQHQCHGLLLDLQRPGIPQARQIVHRILSAVHHPTAVSELYAQDLRCPVFLPPIPPHILPEEHLAPWQHREVWLEAALDGTRLTVTHDGCEATPHFDSLPLPHHAPDLYCHYQITAAPDRLHFTLHRTPTDLTALLHSLPPNVTHTLGLYQELYQ